MRKWLRRIRGAIGMGFTWGLAWGAAGSVLAVVTRFRADAPFPLIFGVLGFFAGVIFSALLALTEGGRTLDEMSLPRFAGWGAMGGLLLSALASAVCASGSLALARRAVARELPDSRGATVELTDHEKRKLPRGGD
jgi:hypothetical protein